MKINKKQIEFFNSYIDKEGLRPVLECLYLDYSTLKQETIGTTVIRRATLVATDGFVLGSMEVELSNSDFESYLIPYKHLAVAKGYLKGAECVEVIHDKLNISYKTNEAEIVVPLFDKLKGEFPPYEKVLVKTETEYSVKINAEYLQNIITSFKKMGRNILLIKMPGADKPMSFESNLDNTVSILMPVRITEDEELGKLQKAK